MFIDALLIHSAPSGAACNLNQQSTLRSAGARNGILFNAINMVLLRSTEVSIQ